LELLDTSRGLLFQTAVDREFWPQLKQVAHTQGALGMADGLWQGPTALTLDYVNVIRRLKLLGFNAIRLPFSMQARLKGRFHATRASRQTCWQLLCR
jgi:hypothetical protein